jgi:L-ascorbate metabolism protein UlaG (beta-lactamase superfamily)
MKIQKLLHSCLLIEEKGKRILVDPGDYSFAEKLITPESLKPIDAIFITHNHSDHCDIDAIRKIQPAHIFGSKSTVATLSAAGITAEVIVPGQTVLIGEVSVLAITAPHDPRLTAPAPESVGYIIGEKLLHPGDSLHFETNHSYEVLALPIAAPWMVRKEALDVAIKLRPAHIIPVHDGMLKDFAAQTNAALAKRFIGEACPDFRALKSEEVLEV